MTRIILFIPRDHYFNIRNMKLTFRVLQLNINQHNMKNYILIIAVLLFSAPAWCQENLFTLSGGYSFANVEEVDTDATGWRINGLYEFNPNAGSVAHGINIGYIATSADFEGAIGQDNVSSEYKINSVPIYYSPKFLFGKGSTKGFIKGALGIQRSYLKRTGTLTEWTADDFGFFGGAGIGLMKGFGEKVFINLEYEWAYMSNSFYKNGFMNSALLGIGIKF